MKRYRPRDSSTNFLLVHRTGPKVLHIINGPMKTINELLETMGQTNYEIVRLESDGSKSFLWKWDTTNEEWVENDNI